MAPARPRGRFLDRSAALLRRGGLGARAGRVSEPGRVTPAASLQAYGGAIAEVPDADSAFSHRDGTFEFVASPRWSDPAENEQRIGAARRYAATLEPFATGMYVNAMSDEGAAGVARAYPPAKLARLRTLKAAHDPGNVFHLNQNIEPA